MPDTIWASIKTDWHAEAVCAGADDYQFFPKIETEQSLNMVRRKFCDRCSVRAKCLNSALINGDIGYWGGTSTAERQSLKKARRRATCPLCRSNNLIRVESADDDPEYGPFQVCLSCAASWRSRSLLHLVKDQEPVEAKVSCP